MHILYITYIPLCCVHVSPQKNKTLASPSYDYKQILPSRRVACRKVQSSPWTATRWRWNVKSCSEHRTNGGTLGRPVTMPEASRSMGGKVWFGDPWKLAGNWKELAEERLAMRVEPVETWQLAVVSVEVSTVMGLVKWVEIFVRLFGCIGAFISGHWKMFAWDDHIDSLCENSDLSKGFFYMAGFASWLIRANGDETVTL